MASKLAIINRGLTMFGHRRIVALTSDSEAVRAVNAVWDMLVDEVLEAADWDFARRTEVLSLVRAITDSTDVLYGSWNYLYAKPNNSLKMRHIFLPGQRYPLSTLEPDFAELQDNNITVYGSDRQGALGEFTARVTDTSAWSAAFTATLSAALAAEVCMPLTLKADLAGTMIKIYGMRLNEAQRQNSERDKDKERPSGGYVDVRGGGKRRRLEPPFI